MSTINNYKEEIICLEDMGWEEIVVEDGIEEQ